MATLTVQQATSSGPSLTGILTASSSNGDAWANTGKEVVIVMNPSTSGVSATITVTAQQPCNFGISTTSHDATYTVPADSGLYVLGIQGGGFPPNRFSDTSQLAHITYSIAPTTPIKVMVMSVAPK